MFQNLILNWLTGMVGKRLDGQKTKIGGVALILAALCQVIMNLFPDLQIPGMEQVDWDTTLTMGRDGLAAVGVAFGATGTAHKIFKEGLKLPCPEELCPPPSGEELDRRTDTSSAAGNNKKWDGKVPGQFP